MSHWKGLRFAKILGHLATAMTIRPSKKPSKKLAGRRLAELFYLSA